jgi:hypothetical protein
MQKYLQVKAQLAKSFSATAQIATSGYSDYLSQVEGLYYAN